MKIDAQSGKETPKDIGGVEPVKPGKGLEPWDGGDHESREPKPKPNPKPKPPREAIPSTESPSYTKGAHDVSAPEEGEVISEPAPKAKAKANASSLSLTFAPERWGCSTSTPKALKPPVAVVATASASTSTKSPAPSSSSSSSTVPPKASHAEKPSSTVSSEKAKPPKVTETSLPLSKSKSKPPSVANATPTPTPTPIATASNRTISDSSGSAAASSGSTAASSLPPSVSKAKAFPAATSALSKSKSASATKAKASKASSSSLGSKSTIKASSSSASKPLPTSGSGSKALKKGARKKRKAAGPDEVEHPKVGGDPSALKKVDPSALKKVKKVKRKKEKEEEKKPEKIIKKPRKQSKKPSSSSPTSTMPGYSELFSAPPGLTTAQLEVQEKLRKALEEDQYSANGSIVDTDTDDEDHKNIYKELSVRLDRAHLLQIAKKCNWLGDGSGTGSVVTLSTRGLSGSSKDNNNATNANDDDDADDEEGILNADGTTNNGGTSSKKKSSRSKKKGRNQYSSRKSSSAASNNSNNGGFRIDDKSSKGFADGSKPRCIGVVDKGMDAERDEGSIFGQTTGSSQFTWVECDKCKKWRRLRGIVDERKLPPKWYCTMNKNDPDRARCSAPEEEYEAAHTPESAADARTRKHLRVWVRRLQCNEQYESRLPTLTRGKKRAVASSSKEPHEWIRCCNPSCGKWRAILRIMDAKQNVIDRTSNAEWYCVMNTWDEKTASCAAPQENLPAVGCPPWVMQDEN